MSILYVTDRIQIPHSEFELSFARSGGPGGQNVNKVNSKVILRWQVLLTHSIPYDVRNRFLAVYANRLTADGELILTSQKFRDQPSNIEDCLQKLREMLETVAVAPTPRRATRPTLASKVRRSESKNLHSAKKQQRRSPRNDD